MSLEGDALSVREGMQARDKMAPTLGQGVGADTPECFESSSSAGTGLLTF